MGENENGLMIYQTRSEAMELHHSDKILPVLLSPSLVVVLYATQSTGMFYGNMFSKVWQCWYYIEHCGV